MINLWNVNPLICSENRRDIFKRKLIRAYIYISDSKSNWKRIIGRIKLSLSHMLCLWRRKYCPWQIVESVGPNGEASLQKQKKNFRIPGMHTHRFPFHFWKILYHVLAWNEESSACWLIWCMAAISVSSN